MRLFAAACLILILSSCHVTRQVQTHTLNVDSLATHIRDSAAEVIRETSESYNEIIKQMTQSGVTFDNDCPDLSAIRASLDSMGRINFDLALRKDSVIHVLNNKVKILSDGSIEASGRVKTVYFINNKLVEENRSLASRNDSLWAVHNADSVKLAKAEADKSVKVVKKTRFPWWLLLIGAVGAWVVRGRLQKYKPGWFG